MYYLGLHFTCQGVLVSLSSIKECISRKSDRQERVHLEIGERLRQIRKRIGLTQREAAKQSGMAFQYLSDLECGRNTNPSLASLRRLAEAYGVGVDDLVGHGVPRDPAAMPPGLRELLDDPEWADQVTTDWVETLLRIKCGGRGLQTKHDFLEAFLALRRIFG